MCKSLDDINRIDWLWEKSLKPAAKGNTNYERQTSGRRKERSWLASSASCWAALVSINSTLVISRKASLSQIVLSFGMCVGGIIGLIEGIIYLTKSDEDFVATYINGKKGWF